MESAVQLPRHVVFDLSGAGLRCFTPPPPAERIGVPLDTQVMALQALHRTRLPRADLAAHRPLQTGTTTNSCGDHVQISDPDTVSDAGTSVVQVAKESEDQVDSFDELFFEESFVRKIGALAEPVGMKKGAYEPAAVLGEVVRMLQGIDGKGERSVCATRAL